MNSGNDFLREEPPAYCGSAKPSPIYDYLRRIEADRQQGNDTEHTHRPALKALLEALDARITATNETKRIVCGAPDLAITQKKTGLLLGHVEAKDIGVSLNEAKKSDQVRTLPARAFQSPADRLPGLPLVRGRRGARPVSPGRNPARGIR